MIDRKALAIARSALGRPPLRFSDLQRVIQNPRTLSLKLKKLQGEGLIVKENGRYRLTPVGEQAVRLLEGYQRLVGGGFLKNLDKVPHAAYRPLLRDYCELLWGSYQERLEGVILFGSIARGAWRKESDIDLFVVVEGWKNVSDWERVEELSAVKGKLAKCDSHSDAIRAGFYPAIHALPLDPSELKSFQPYHLDVSTDGIVLFDRTGAMKEFVDSVRSWAESAGSRRITRPGGSFYWVLAPIRLGEVVEFGHKP